MNGSYVWIITKELPYGIVSVWVNESDAKAECSYLHSNRVYTGLNVIKCEVK